MSMNALIEDNTTLKGFCDSLMKLVDVDKILENQQPEPEQNEDILSEAEKRLNGFLADGKADYVDLLRRYAPEIGPVLYGMDNWGYPMPIIDFFGEHAKEFFRFIVCGYINIHLDEYRPDCSR